MKEYKKADEKMLEEDFLVSDKVLVDGSGENMLVSDKMLADDSGEGTLVPDKTLADDSDESTLVPDKTLADDSDESTLVPDKKLVGDPVDKDKPVENLDKKTDIMAHFCGVCGHHFENQTDLFCPICGKEREVIL